MTTSNRTHIVLFTRDLRVHDHPALHSAIKSGCLLLPLFVADPRLLARSPNRTHFLCESLGDLRNALRARGGELVLAEGSCVQVITQLAKRLNVTAIHVSRDYSAYALRRQRALSALCRDNDWTLHLHDGHAAVAPGVHLPANGDHYKVFTPYFRRWAQTAGHAPLPDPRTIAFPHGTPAGRMPRAPRNASKGLPHGGESEARRLWLQWRRVGVTNYASLRDQFAAQGGSGLSPYLRFGNVSANALVYELAGDNGLAGANEAALGWLRQLCWRDFHLQVLAANPSLPHRDYRPRRTWRDDAAELDAWRSGKTGLPIIDAAMRELTETGLMHNRARMLVASFLTKRLNIHWRHGFTHFDRWLVDGDVANNAGNWQWVAGTGNDTRPNRILNPLVQAKRFDPNGDYVRRWLPQLAKLTRAEIHEPWQVEPARRDFAYPSPMVRMG